jgi:hypothetical protein
LGLDILIEGQVKSKTSGMPIEGIKVSFEDYMDYVLTNNEGRFSYYSEILDKMEITFKDIDSTQNGLYLDKDTVLTNVKEHVFLEINLDEK